MISVLYVDDEPNLLELGRLYLEKSGEFQVTTSTSAQEALELPSLWLYDIIISDYQMPGMNGITFLKAVREQFGDIPFILFTGRGREEVVIEAINNGADFYLQKGGDPKSQFAELSHKIRQAVRRKEAERSLQQSEQQLSNIIDFLPDATFAIDRSGQVIAWNHAIEEMTGIPAEGMLGKGDYAYAVPFYGSRHPILIDLVGESDEKITEFYANSYRTENSITAETDLPHPKGYRISVLAKAGPLYNPSGEIVGAIESIRDITARKNNEAALQQVSLELQLIFRNMINAFIVWESVFDENGRYVSFRFGQFNDAYARIAKLKAEDVRGKDVFEIWPATEQGWVEVYGSVATTGIPRVFDMYHEPTKGWYHCNAYRPTESTAQICVIFEDITKRRQAELELQAAYEKITAAEGALRQQYDELIRSEQLIRESESKYRDLVENANSIIMKWDKDGTITFFNEFAQGFFGYTRDEIIGKSVIGTIVPATESGSDRNLHLMIDDIIRNPENHIFNENENITRDGNRVWIRWQNKILLDENGQFDGLFSIGTDITKRKEAERALQESEKRYRDMFELNNAVMLIINPETGSITDANSAASRYYGYSHEEFTRLAITDINVADPAIPRKNMSHAAEDHGAVFSFRHRKKNGEIRDVEVFSAPVTLGSHRLLHSIVQDVTERKLAEEALITSEKKYRTLFENMLEGFAYCKMIFDDRGRPADWVYLDVNAAFERLTGLKNIIGKRVLEAIPDIRTSNPELFDTYGRVASTGNPDIFEINFTPLKIWLKVSVFSPEKGYFVAVFEDISTRKAAEAALLEKTEELDRFFSLTLDLLCIADTDGYFHKLNKSWEKLLGYSQEELLAHRFLDFVHPDDMESTLKAVASLKDQNEVLNFVNRYRCRDGTYRWIEWLSYPYGNLIYAAARDITGRKLADEALRQANRKLNLLSGITRHDIRNQLLALEGFLEISKEFLGDPARMSEYIAKEELIAGTIAHQISFTKDYEDMGVNAPVWQNVNAIIKMVLTRLPLQNVRVDADDPGLQVFADPLLEKVFYNLIDNALKYGGEKMTAINVTTRNEKGQLVIVMEDDGNGITAEDKKQLFTRGFGKHTGLGLYLSREILSITGITITENGEPGKGARFEIVVPAGGFRQSSGN